MNLIGAITVKLYDGLHNLLATNMAKLAHIKELTATQKQFSPAFIVQSGTYPTGGVSSSWECGAWLPAIGTKPVTAEIEIVGTGTDGGNSWERAGFSGSADRTFSWTVPARFSSRAKVIMDAMDAASNLLSDAFPAAFVITPATPSPAGPVTSLAPRTRPRSRWMPTGPLPLPSPHRPRSLAMSMAVAGTSITMGSFYAERNIH